MANSHSREEHHGREVMVEDLGNIRGLRIRERVAIFGLGYGPPWILKGDGVISYLTSPSLKNGLLVV